MIQTKVWGSHKQNIFDYQFKTTPDKSFEYSLEFEQRLAARWAGYTWKEFQALVGDPRWITDNENDCKAYVIAAFRISNRIESIQNDYEAKK